MDWPLLKLHHIIFYTGGGATRPLLRDGGLKELHGDPTVEPRPKAGPKIKSGRNSAKDGAPERRRYGIIQEVDYFLYSCCCL